MNMSILKTAGLYLLLGFLAHIVPLSLQAGDNKVTLEVCVNEFDMKAEAEIKDRISNMDGLFEMRHTPEVMSYIKDYLGYKEGTSTILGRQMVFFPLFEDVLAKKDVPTDLKYLPIVESALNPNAISRVGAAGLWQFMRSTGRMMGLRINSVVDERRNPYRSTEAAADYLQLLYEEFEDWTLVLAAYNAGPGRVRKAISRADSRDFWKIKRYLPSETRRYVPAFIAVNYVMNYYYLHDIQPVLEHPDYLNVSNITLYETMNFREISEITGVEVGILRKLNPCYLRQYIPANENGSYVMLPSYAATLLLNHLYIPDSETETVQDGWLNDKLISPSDLHLLRPQVEVLERLPVPMNQDLFHNEGHEVPEIELMGRTEEDAVWYRLKKRESLLAIARRKKISFEKLIELNSGWDQDLNPGSLIRLR
ncbi:MAG: transglycosylase SLT domain-containing protein [Saprospiraceae bacterium]|nr:transglycosylase SLT domain-containing protein [Saprospiraceae bacterium]